MPAISFQPRFGPAIENGLDLIAGRRMRHRGVRPKLQTLRLPRIKGQPKPGDRLRLWERQRSPARRFLGEVECLFVRPIQISVRFEVQRAGSDQWWPVPKRGPKRFGMFVQRRVIEVPWLPIELDELARRDGFEVIDELVRFLESMHGVPRHGRAFQGIVISWDPRRPYGGDR